MNGCIIYSNCVIEDCLLHNNVEVCKNIILPKGSVIGSDVILT